MGKKRIVKKGGGSVDQGLKARSLSRIPKKKIVHGTLHIQSTYNNTVVSLADSEGNVLMWSSSGSLGFTGAKKGTPFADLGLDDQTLPDAALIDAMMAHPILINRPLVVSPKGVRLCRPSEAVLELLPHPLPTPFVKEDGDVVGAA